MIATSESDLICDLAETYGIYDYRALPVKMLAVLSSGLREDSRIRMKLSGAKETTEVILLAAMVDRLSLLFWAQTEDGLKNRNKPKSILDMLNGKSGSESDLITFDTVEDFEAARKRILGKEN